MKQETDLKWSSWNESQTIWINYVQYILKKVLDVSRIVIFVFGFGYKSVFSGIFSSHDFIASTTLDVFCFILLFMVSECEKESSSKVEMYFGKLRQAIWQVHSQKKESTIVKTT